MLSIGLLRAIDLASFEECVLNSYSTGGDAFITICLWEVCAVWSVPNAKRMCARPPSNALWQQAALSIHTCHFSVFSVAILQGHCPHKLSFKFQEHICQLMVLSSST